MARCGSAQTLFAGVGADRGWTAVGLTNAWDAAGCGNASKPETNAKSGPPWHAIVSKQAAKPALF